MDLITSEDAEELARALLAEVTASGAGAKLTSTRAFQVRARAEWVLMKVEGRTCVLEPAAAAELGAQLIQSAWVAMGFEAPPQAVFQPVKKKATPNSGSLVVDV
ncbi:MAG: hypothetical protein Q8M88_13845 [Phenylobacterium sp.]|uniref:hypothetical protein n=1 Tax=Phenylobacterium sp. TaxID=1871053 RepID=UPI0027346E6F|nr:hypothetical protein [Phenylobacterium sp.]MDP3175511.1 hypothetical protein [Phenylobacterium sp.]